MKKTLLRLTCFLSIAFCLLAAAVTSIGQSSNAQVTTDVDRIEQMFKNAGVTYVRKSDIFITDRNSRRFIFTLNKDLIVGFSVMAQKGKFQSSAAALQSFLAASHRYDYVKMVIDEDGDLSVRFDSSLRVLDQKEFERLVNQLINAEGEIRKDIQPFLSSANQ